MKLGYFVATLIAPWFLNESYKLDPLWIRSLCSTRLMSYLYNILTATIQTTICRNCSTYTLPCSWITIFHLSFFSSYFITITFWFTLRTIKPFFTFTFSFTIADIFSAYRSICITITFWKKLDLLNYLSSTLILLSNYTYWGA